MLFGNRGVRPMPAAQGCESFRRLVTPADQIEAEILSAYAGLWERESG